MSLRVLVVDDHHDTVALFVEVLRHAGFDALGTTRANEALSLTIADPPAVLVVDIAMPDLDGRELATLVRSYANTKHVRLVAVSAHAFDFSRFFVPGGGGWDACLRKPCDPDALVATVRSVLREIPPGKQSGTRRLFLDAVVPKKEGAKGT